MRMGDRTDSRDALVQLCWYLNYHEGEDLSINQIANETGLAWATVHNSLITLEKIQRLGPDVNKGDSVQVGKSPPRIQEMKEDSALEVVTYMMTQRKNTGEIQDPFVIDDHSLLDRNRDVLENADSLGWVELDGNTVSLTPTGVKIAGPAHSRLENCD